MSEKANRDSQTFVEEVEVEADEQEIKRIRRKVDLRLCTIVGKFYSLILSRLGPKSESGAETLVGVLACLNIVDGGTISSASVAGLLEDLQLEDGNRYSVAIFIFTLAQVMFSLPATICVRLIGPRASFAVTTFLFGAFTIVSVSLRQIGSVVVLEPDMRLEQSVQLLCRLGNNSLVFGFCLEWRRSDQILGFSRLP